MKKVLSVAAVLMVLFVGCSKDVNINSPVQDQVTEEFVTRTGSQGLSSEATFSTSKVIDGSKGGLLQIGDQWTTQSGKQGSVYAYLYFPAGAFSGIKTITMTVDNGKLTGTFGPGMSFSKPVSFSVLFAGVNLSNQTQSQYTFVYYDTAGKKYEISSSYIYFDRTKGVLGILNAQLPHFSRYGFIRKAA